MLLTRREFARSLDAFPVEFGEIIDTHETLFGDDPFAGLIVAARRPAPGLRGPDAHRCCCTCARTTWKPPATAAPSPRLVVDSAPEFRALFEPAGAARRPSPRPAATWRSWAAERLALDPRTVSDVLHVANTPDGSGVDAVRLFPAYLAAVEHLARRVDEW